MLLEPQRGCIVGGEIFDFKKKRRDNFVNQNAFFLKSKIPQNVKSPLEPPWGCIFKECKTYDFKENFTYLAESREDFLL